MLRHAVVFFALLMFSPNAFPTTTLPTVKVVGFRVSGWVTLCEGAGCNDYFFTPSHSEPLPGEATLPEDDPRVSIELVCSHDKTTREDAVWDAYKRMMNAYHTNPFDMRNADGEIQSSLIPITVRFSNGSVGTYIRTGEPYSSQTGGLVETQAPNCG